MDQETDESKRTVENLSQVSRAPGENSSSYVNGVVTNSVEASSVSRGDLGSNNYEVGSRKALVEAQEMVINHGAGDRRVIAENSSNLVDEVLLETVSVRNSEERTSFSGENSGVGLKIDVVEAPNMYNRQRVGERIGQIDQVLETVILVNLDQAACVSGEGNELESKSNELGSSEALVEISKKKEPKVDKESCVIDIKCGGGAEKGFKESRNEEWVCRICHLDSEQLLETMSSTATIDNSTLDLIQLGCGCKAELGIAHSHCAEAWFKLKGNRLCEICGQTARNVTGVGDFRFMEEWNEHGFIGGSSSSSERSGCWRGQPFCNFLMACLVIAFVLPWFFRVNLF